MVARELAFSTGFLHDFYGGCGEFGYALLSEDRVSKGRVVSHGSVRVREQRYSEMGWLARYKCSFEGNLAI